MPENGAEWIVMIKKTIIAKEQVKVLFIGVGPKMKCQRESMALINLPKSDD